MDVIYACSVGITSHMFKHLCKLRAYGIGDKLSISLCQLLYASCKVYRTCKHSFQNKLGVDSPDVGFRAVLILHIKSRCRVAGDDNYRVKLLTVNYSRKALYAQR